ncbi:MAG: DUF1844 domain-containing protein [Candidatus Rokubacteria bacterium]|nr:DUF1844 domain-containing protein [Candidatus Rokubacteria bacterium]
MVPAEPDEGFKVTDRRRRHEDDEAAASPAPEAAGSEARPSEFTAAERDVQSRTVAEPIVGSGPGRDLTGLFVMLASSAAMALGEAPDPMTGEVHRDLGQAAELIDLLVLLREKTEGRRTPEETEVIEEVIYDLQMRYVAATRPSGPRPGPSRP